MKKIIILVQFFILLPAVISGEDKNSFFEYSPAVEKLFTETQARKSIGLEDIDKEANRLEKEFGNEFTVEKVSPFIIVANMKRLNSYERILEKCQAFFNQDFFEKKLDRVIVCYLFDKTVYKDFIKKIGKEDKSRFGGFADIANGYVVCNMDNSGREILCHEIAHIYLETDIPKIPNWFNEGFAKFFDAWMLNGGKVDFTASAHLPELQLNIRQGTFVKFEKLMKMNAIEFQKQTDVNLYYSELLYVCLFLEKKKRLAEFYKKLKTEVAAGSVYEISRDGNQINILPEFSDSFTVFKSFMNEPIENVEKEFCKWVLSLKGETPPFTLTVNGQPMVVIFPQNQRKTK